VRAGLYEARSLIGEKKIAYVVLDDAATLRLHLHRCRSALKVIRWYGGPSGHAAKWALRDVEEGA
jgi:hypothetical protein